MGACGYALHRQLATCRIPCEVVALLLTPGGRGPDQALPGTRSSWSSSMALRKPVAMRKCEPDRPFHFREYLSDEQASYPPVLTARTCKHDSMQRPFQIALPSFQQNSNTATRHVANNREVNMSTCQQEEPILDSLASRRWLSGFFTVFGIDQYGQRCSNMSYPIDLFEAVGIAQCSLSPWYGNCLPWSATTNKAISSLDSNRISEDRRKVR